MQAPYNSDFISSQNLTFEHTTSPTPSYGEWSVGRLRNQQRTTRQTKKKLLRLNSRMDHCCVIGCKKPIATGPFLPDGSTVIITETPNMLRLSDCMEIDESMDIKTHRLTFCPECMNEIRPNELRANRVSFESVGSGLLLIEL